MSHRSHYFGVVFSWLQEGDESGLEATKRGEAEMDEEERTERMTFTVSTRERHYGSHCQHYQDS